MTLKKIIALLLAIATVFCMAACDGAGIQWYSGRV